MSSNNIHLIFTLVGWGIAATLRMWNARHFAIAAIFYTTPIM